MIRESIDAISSETLSEFGLEVSSVDSELRLHRGDMHRVHLKQPTDSRELALLARAVSNVMVNQAGSVMVVVTESGVWPSEEWPELLDRYMLSFGDGRPIAEAPIFIVDHFERDPLTNLLRIALTSGWGALVLTDASVNGFELTDDDYVAVYGADEAAVVKCVSQLRSDGVSAPELWSGIWH